jgi:hypothetical protein
LILERNNIDLSRWGVRCQVKAVEEWVRGFVVGVVEKVAKGLESYTYELNNSNIEDILWGEVPQSWGDLVFLGESLERSSEDNLERVLDDVLLEELHGLVIAQNDQIDIRVEKGWLVEYEELLVTQISALIDLQSHTNVEFIHVLLVVVVKWVIN